MDAAYITELEDHFMDVVQEMIKLDGSFKSHIDFARAAFNDDVSNCSSKWGRLRLKQKNITIADIARISAALNISTGVLFTLAEHNMRKSKLRKK